jgi:hypothetical protein
VIGFTVFIQWFALFIGPNGKRDHKVSVSRDYQMVGSGDRSPEITSQLSYLNRPPPGAKFPKAKNGQVGEIGWLYETFRIVKGIWYTVTCVRERMYCCYVWYIGYTYFITCWMWRYQWYSIQHYVIKFLSDLRQVCGFLRSLRFPPLIKLTATI